MMRSPICSRLVAALLCGLATAGARPLSAAELDPAGWTVTGPDGQRIFACADRDPDTAWVSALPQREGQSVTIDLGTTVVVHRVVLLTGEAVSGYPRGLRLQTGTARDALATVFAQTGLYRPLLDLRFNPVPARFLKLTLHGEGAGYPWTLAETMVYGVPHTEAGPTACVALPPGLPPPLQSAAEDLAYYLTELTDSPVLLADLHHALRFKGTVYQVLPAPPFGRYKDFIQSERFHHQERFHVVRKGNVVRFGGVTTRAVMYAVYEFLHRNGVRWLYPDALGEHVPAAAGVDLGVLPIRWEPPFERRYANWNTQRYTTDPAAYLWHFRNRWNESWGGPINDRPGLPEPERQPSFGYTHTFAGLVPGELFAEHPDWFPLLRDEKWADRIGRDRLGTRIPYSATWGLNFCTSNEAVIDFVVQRIIENTQPDRARVTAWLTPMDAAVFCECDRCLALDRGATDGDASDVPEETRMSNRYFTFIHAVAERVRGERPNLRIGAFAYDSYLHPPPRFPRLPDNVIVDVVQYGVYNLPISAPVNRDVQDLLYAWSQRWDRPGHVGVYDWSLLLGEADGRPVTLVRGLAQRLRLFHRLGVERVGTQANAVPDVWRYNPWNFYAYSRLCWKPTEDPERVMDDFFHGYYGPAGQSMRHYYDTLDAHLIGNEVALGDIYHYRATAGAYPHHVLRAMGEHLDRAESEAEHWIVRRRVADAREGWRRTLERCRITPEALIADDDLPQAGPANAVHLNADTVTLHTAGYAVDGAWSLFANGRIGGYVRIRQAGTYRLEARASGTAMDGIWPQMKLQVGPREAGTFTVASTDPRWYGADLELEAGTWEMSAAFLNDGLSKDEDRNLTITDLRLRFAGAVE